MKKNIIFLLSIFILFNSSNLKANAIDAQNWLDSEISQIINLYRDDSIESETKLTAIQDSINKSFAGNGIGRFVAGNAWGSANEIVQKQFIKLFKEHLYLTIGSLMESYSNQTYDLVNSRKDKNKGVYLIDMEVSHNEQTTLITWRVKESKEKFYVIDLMVADISLVITKRAEFNSMLKKVNNDLAELNHILKDQNIQSYENLIN